MFGENVGEDHSAGERKQFRRKLRGDGQEVTFRGESQEVSFRGEFQELNANFQELTGELQEMREEGERESLQEMVVEQRHGGSRHLETDLLIKEEDEEEYEVTSV